MEEKPKCRTCLFCQDTGEVFLCQITDEVVNPDDIACDTYQEDLDQ